MKDGLFGILELSIFLGIPLVWAVRELIKLRREQARDREAQVHPRGEDGTAGP